MPPTVICFLKHYDDNGLWHLKYSDNIFNDGLCQPVFFSYDFPAYNSTVTIGKVSQGIAVQINIVCCMYFLLLGQKHFLELQNEYIIAFENAETENLSRGRVLEYCVSYDDAYKEALNLEIKRN